jgi:hypothetical protein
MDLNISPYPFSFISVLFLEEKFRPQFVRVLCRIVVVMNDTLPWPLLFDIQASI